MEFAIKWPSMKRVSLMRVIRMSGPEAAVMAMGKLEKPAPTGHPPQAEGWLVAPDIPAASGYLTAPMKETSPVTNKSESTALASLK